MSKKIVSTTYTLEMDSSTYWALSYIVERHFDKRKNMSNEQYEVKKLFDDEWDVDATDDDDEGGG